MNNSFLYHIIGNAGEFKKMKNEKKSYLLCLSAFILQLLLFDDVSKTGRHDLKVFLIKFTNKISTRIKYQLLLRRFNTYAKKRGESLSLLDFILQSVDNGSQLERIHFKESNGNH
jgi:hypothetical protein